MAHSEILALAALTLLAAPSEGKAHDWYPYECCHDIDCAPVTRVERSDSGGMVVTSQHGIVFIPDSMMRRESKDARMHVCMRPGLNGMRAICIFVPPLM